MLRLRQMLPAAVRALGRRWLDAVRARRAWRLMIRRARSGRRPAAGAQAGEGHVCLVAWSFPPVVTGGTYRPLALVEHGTRAGLSFTVVSCPFHQAPSRAGRHLAERVPAEARVVRTAVPALRPAAGALPDLDGGALNVLEIWKSAERTFGESGPPDIVFATGPPFHSFVAGELLAARHGVPLVLEYRDEWTECPFEFVRTGPDDRSFEASCLAAADMVVFTTESQLEHQLEVFAELERRKCVVIPNGWEPGAEAEYSRRDAAPEGPCIISFTGNLGDHTLPDGFLDTLSSAVRRRPELVHRFRFRFVGKKSSRAMQQLTRFAFAEMIQMVDQVPKDEVPRILQESGALLLLNGPDLARYIPGKLYEYLASGRPILVYGAGGEVDSLVRRLDAGQIVPQDDDLVLATALDRLEAARLSTYMPPERSEWLERHTRQVLSRQTIELLRKLIRDGRGGAGKEAE